MWRWIIVQMQKVTKISPSLKPTLEILSWKPAVIAEWQDLRYHLIVTESYEMAGGEPKLSKSELLDLLTNYGQAVFDKDAAIICYKGGYGKLIFEKRKNNVPLVTLLS